MNCDERRVHIWNELILKPLRELAAQRELEARYPNVPPERIALEIKRAAERTS